ncbi:uncharacterized protein [Heptranchias perlo]|uniref:uncharacterized protein isoform X2 n=1 Tax=Heptranchias perlo TaxID=212740 RepID=UPI0035596C99
MNCWSGLDCYIPVWLLLILGLFTVGQSVCTEHSLKHQAVCGGTALLPCHFTGGGEQAEVTWQKKVASSDLVVHAEPPSSAQDIIYKHRTGIQQDWNKKKDAELTIRGITSQDGGTYICYVRLHPESKSETCSEICLEVNRGEDAVWAASSQVTVMAGEVLELHCGFNPNCFNSTASAVTWSYGDGSSDDILVRNERISTAAFWDGNRMVRFEPGDGSATRGGQYQCCLGDDPARPKRCAFMNVTVAESTSGAEAGLGRHCQYSAALLLAEFFLIAAILTGPAI